MAIRNKQMKPATNLANKKAVTDKGIMSVHSMSPEFDISHIIFTSAAAAAQTENARAEK